MGRQGKTGTGAELATIAVALMISLTACGGSSADRAAAPSDTTPAGSLAVRGTIDRSPSGELTTSLPPQTDLPTTTLATSTTTTIPTTTTSTTVVPVTTAAPTTTESPTYRPTMQWFAANGAVLDVIRADDDERSAAGTNWPVLGAVCARYKTDLATLTAALPVPNAVVNASFQQAVSLLGGGVIRCISAAAGQGYEGYTIAEQQYFNPGMSAFGTAVGYRNQQRLPT